MAAKQPKKKDMSVFNVGTPRPLVIAEIGSPVHTEKVSGSYIDTFSFVQGYSKANKASRAVAHGAADVLTLGLWEVLATPAESVFDGSEVKAQVYYDSADRVKKVKAFDGEKHLPTAE